MLELIAQSTAPISLTLTDINGAPLDLTGATEVRWQATGSATIGPIVCSVTNAAGGIITLPLTVAQRQPGSYRYEAEARWGTTRITAAGDLRFRPDTIPTIEVTQGDAPTVSVQVAGHDFSGQSVDLIWGSNPEGTLTSIDGSVTAPGTGGTDRADVTLTGVDTASVGTRYGRITADGVTTGLIRIDIVAQGLI